MPSPIKSILHIINSRRDFYGNCYWAFTFTDCASGVVVRGTVSSGPSNVEMVKRYYRPRLKDWDRTMAISEEEMPIREFNRRTKGWQYAGCSPEDIAKWIRAEVKKAKDCIKDLSKASAPALLDALVDPTK